MHPVEWQGLPIFEVRDVLKLAVFDMALTIGV